MSNQSASEEICLCDYSLFRDSIWTCKVICTRNFDVFSRFSAAVLRAKISYNCNQQEVRSHIAVDRTVHPTKHIYPHKHQDVLRYPVQYIMSNIDERCRSNCSNSSTNYNIGDHSYINSIRMTRIVTPRTQPTTEILTMSPLQQEKQRQEEGMNTLIHKNRLISLLDEALLITIPICAMSINSEIKSSNGVAPD